MAYAAGQKYLRNKVTGAVFQYRPSIEGFAHLELCEADEEGNLVKVSTRVVPDRQLAPAATPEKENPELAKEPIKEAPKPPTLAPVSK